MMKTTGCFHDSKWDIEIKIIRKVVDCMVKNKFDFDEVLDRRGTASEKWDFMKERFGYEDLLPLWVADMDFRSPQPVIEALVSRAKHGVFGYTGLTQSYYDSVISWYKRKYNWAIRKDWIVFTPGVIPAIAYAIRSFTNPGDKIIVQTPVYYPFFNTIEANGRQVLENPLKFKNDHYEMDFDDLEKKAKDPRAKMMILCSPHNPIGRVWTRKELTRLGEICTENGLLVISDEIHSDIRYPGIVFTNFATISGEFANNSITCTSASKTFNLAGLQISNIIIPNDKIRQNFQNAVSTMGMDLPNSFSGLAVQVAYDRCGTWLDQFLTYLKGNLDFLKEFIKKNIPEVKVIEPQATYLVWLDFRKIEPDPEKLQKLLLKDAKVAFVEGNIFRSGGDGFERINIACPRSVLKKALEQMARVLKDGR
ncbi:MAG: pyridoxal phosphate-dependent aminotransferase [Candidatus Thermoplasmatota archaeon]|nr:pyridoxal phosphate-dependent aminotransferase [Candidatus Thermoplasmatota archaeon]